MSVTHDCATTALVIYLERGKIYFQLFALVNEEIRGKKREEKAKIRKYQK